MNGLKQLSSAGMEQAAAERSVALPDREPAAGRRPADDPSPARPAQIAATDITAPAPADTAIASGRGAAPRTVADTMPPALPEQPAVVARKARPDPASDVTVATARPAPSNAASNVSSRLATC